MDVCGLISLVTPRQLLIYSLPPSCACACANNLPCSARQAPSLPPVGVLFVNSSLNFSFEKLGHGATRAALLATVNGPLLSRTRDNGLLGPVALPSLGTQGYSI